MPELLIAGKGLATIGIGLDEAGVSGLAYAEKLGMAMVTLATESCCIGDAQDQYVRATRRSVASRNGRAGHR